ncbi:unnamed protein product [Trichogramma brassicae]|uniref:Uncharacterized protein n=1 Tax=Trichogramma brassicae TaxID=86971 RepID=A0A6H5J7F2_9HYME|nr:unnamed protein product [Trichogramma brassicae]
MRERFIHGAAARAKLECFYIYPARAARCRIEESLHADRRHTPTKHKRLVVVSHAQRRTTLVPFLNEYSAHPSRAIPATAHVRARDTFYHPSSSKCTDFIRYTHIYNRPTTASFDDPAFGQEEPPAHSDCDFPSNHNYDNVEGSKITKRPHGFQIDPNFSSTQSNHLDTKKKERNLDNQKGVNSNSIVQTPKNSNRLNQSERFYNPSHSFKPPKDSGFKDEYAGPAMELANLVGIFLLSKAYYWKTVDYEFDNDEDRRSLLYAGTFIPENNLPLGLEISKDRIFVSLPRWKKGIPATLATISTNSDDRSPKLKPYPDWRWHHLGTLTYLIIKNFRKI